MTEPKDSSFLRTVFVAEDDPVMGHLLTLNLSRAGYAVRTGQDGRLVLEELTRGPVDLLILDYGLPGMNGLQILQELRKQTETVCPPVIVVTGHAREDVQQELKTAGARAVFTKPFSPTTLMEAVAEAIANG